MTAACKVTKDLHTKVQQHTANHAADSIVQKSVGSVESTGSRTEVHSSTTDESTFENKTIVTERFDSAGRLMERVTENSNLQHGCRKEGNSQMSDTTTTKENHIAENLHVSESDESETGIEEQDRHVSASIMPLWAFVGILTSIVLLFLWFRTGANEVFVSGLKDILRKIWKRKE